MVGQVVQVSRKRIRQYHHGWCEKPLTVLSSFWYRKIKCRTGVHVPFCPHLAPMPMDNALNVCQADSGALKFFFTVQPLEDAEELLRISRIETGAVVADVNRFFGI